MEPEIRHAHSESAQQKHRVQKRAHRKFYDDDHYDVTHDVVKEYDFKKRNVQEYGLQEYRVA